MSDTIDPREATNPAPDRTSRLRLWPALGIVAAQYTLVFGLTYFGSTNIHSVIALAIVPAVAALLLIVWWLAASRVPWRDRLAGVALPVLALVLVVFMQHSNGTMLLAYAVPAMTTGVVAILGLTCRIRWTLARWAAVAFILICAGVFAAMRVETVGGNLAPIVSWRWATSAQERSDALPQIDAHATAALPAQAEPADWPAFRGPARDGCRTETRFSTNWSPAPRELWRRKIGSGWSSFIAVGDYVFTQEQRGAEELVTCYAAATGADVWVNRIPARYEDSMGLGPRATPTFLDGRLYTQGATGQLQCLDASTGTTLWKRDVAADTDTDIPGYGFASSPLPVGGLVVTFSCAGEGKTAIAYDLKSGEIAWRAGHGTSVYSSPHLASICGVPQLLMVSDFGLQAFEVETGAALWEHPWKVKTNPRCVQPLIVEGDAVMLGTTGTMGSKLLRIQKNAASWDASEVWMTKRFRPYFNDCVSHKGYCYGFDGERLACIDLKTGQSQWEGKRCGGQLLLLPEMDLFLVLTEAGDIMLVSATPQQYREVASFKAISGKTWNHPVLARGRLFVRNAEEAACFELPPAGPQS